MHLPTHPLWFWLIAGSPLLVWLTMWAVARFKEVSLVSLLPWLKAGLLVFFPISLALDAANHYRVLRLVCGAACYTCWLALLWIDGRRKFETLRAPTAKWYTLGTSARFSIPRNVRIVVRDVNTVAPWYVEKLGLRKQRLNCEQASSVATYRFKSDGNPIILTAKPGFQQGKAPVFFTKKIGKMKRVLAARGIESGPIEHDRQGTAYFELHDPEGNVIEFVEER